MIELSKFASKDILRLLNWIPNARFLLQWAGPEYEYPLDKAQLEKSLEKPNHLIFKAILTKEQKVVGHIELMEIDYEMKTAKLGRVLIGLNHLRGKGYGKKMIHAALEFGFNELSLNTITLAVFDFNEPAINCYQKLGFQQYETLQNARKYGDELWSLVMMKITKKIAQSSRFRVTSACP